MLQTLKRRYLDVLASIYIYNEHRGYTSLDRVLAGVRRRSPDAIDFIAEVEKHRADERKHYVMFQRYFETLGRMPFAVDRTCGHIDRFIKIVFGCHIDELDSEAIAASEPMFNQLCRVIMLTEQRGMRQVDILLNSPVINSDRVLMKIFRIVEQDEPSHWMPYRDWLHGHQGGEPTLRERLADKWVHKSLVLVKLPLLFLNPWLPRRSDWYDSQAERTDSVPALGTS